MMRIGGIVIAMMMAACSPKGGTTGTTTPTTAASSTTAHCSKYVESMNGQGETKMVDRTSKPALAEAKAHCQATVKASSGFTCHFASFETPDAAASAAADVANTFWVVPQSDGKTSYNKAGTTGVVWGGGGEVIPAIEAAARAVADGS